MNKVLFEKYKIQFNFHLSVKKVELRHGLCSKVNYCNSHVVLWDFDNSELNDIKIELKRLQNKYNLSTIYILQSSEKNYHAYCFTPCDFTEVIHILSETRFIDKVYLRLGVARGYYTLRYSDKNNYKIKLIDSIVSSNKAISAHDITTNEYYTTNIK